jgi:UDP-perosamine 4-acetyltransferase
MSGRSLVLLGGGGHAAVVADAARSAGWTVLGFFDDNPQTGLSGPPGVSRLGAISDALLIGRGLAHAAVGSPALRRRWLDAMGDRVAPAIVHAGAIVSPSATIAEGAFIGPGAVVNARASVGRGAIVNSGAIVEHDCVLEPFCHVAPGAALGGGVHVGAESLVGIKAAVRPGIRIEAHATVGAGAVVTRDVPQGATATGIPAR